MWLNGPPWRVTIPNSANQPRHICAVFGLHSLTEWMVMSLWAHQRDTLVRWINADCRGFVGMARTNLSRGPGRPVRRHSRIRKLGTFSTHNGRSSLTSTTGQSRPSGSLQDSWDCSLLLDALAGRTSSIHVFQQLVGGSARRRKGYFRQHWTRGLTLYTVSDVRYVHVRRKVYEDIHRKSEMRRLISMRGGRVRVIYTSIMGRQTCGLHIDDGE